MTLKEFILGVQGTSRRGEKRIKKELTEMFGELRDEYTQEEFEEYMRVQVLGEGKSDKRGYRSNNLRANGCVLGRSLMR